MKRICIAMVTSLALMTTATHAVEQTAFTAVGVIESTIGGFKFPDGSMQLSAILPPCTTITYLPFTISEEGVYCFTGNLSTGITSGYAISIETDNVVLNLNGWKLDGLAAGTGTTTKGIYADQRENITIRNGAIRGFFIGVYLEGVSPYTVSQGHLIEDIHFDKNTGQGVYLIGSSITLRRNQIMNTGGTTFNPDSTCNAVILQGIGGRILDNYMSNTMTTGTGSAYGLSVSATGAAVIGNRIERLNTDTGTTYGMFISSENVLVKGNSITGADYGVYFTAVAGKYRDNLTSNVTTPFNGGTDIGGND